MKNGAIDAIVRPQRGYIFEAWALARGDILKLNPVQLDSTNSAVSDRQINSNRLVSGGAQRSM
jgi:hypothetical protein